MSDCSTKAFQVPEQKTCGTCAHGVKPFVVCMVENGIHYEVRTGTFGSRACDHYESRGDSWEQLARSAFNAFDFWANPYRDEYENDELAALTKTRESLEKRMKALENN